MDCESVLRDSTCGVDLGVYCGARLSGDTSIAMRDDRGRLQVLLSAALCGSCWGPALPDGGRFILCVE